MAGPSLRLILVTSPEDYRERFPDDPGIADDVALLRRVPPRHFVRDDNEGCYRPSSAAFVDDADGHPMSVYRTDVIEAEGEEPDRVLVGHAGFGLVAIAAGTMREKEQAVHPDPLPEETSHTLVCGPKTRGTRRFFARRAVWVVPPPV